MLLLAISTVCTLLIMLALALGMCKLGWIDPEKHTDVFGKLVVVVSAPAIIVYNVFAQEFAPGAFKWMLVSIITHIAVFAMTFAFSPALKVPKNRRGVFATLSSVPNIIFLGMPIILGLYGEEVMPVVTMCFIPSIVFMWTVGVVALKSDTGKGFKLAFSRETLKHLLNPSVVATVVSIALVLIGFRPPSFIMEVFRYFGSMCTPVSMIFLGLILYKSGRGSVSHMNATSAWLLVAKFALMPLIAYLSCLALGISGLPQKALTVMLATPSAVMVGVAAHAEGADGDYAASNTVLTTIAGMLIMPLIAIALG